MNNLEETILFVKIPLAELYISYNCQRDMEIGVESD